MLSSQLAGALCILGLIQNERGQTQDALRTASRATSIEKSFSAMRLYSKIYQRTGDLNNAEKYAEEAVALCEKSTASPMQLAKCYDNLANVLKGNKKQAESLPEMP